MKKKLSFLISHPIQYYTPWFRELSKEVELTVLYCSDETLSGYKDKEFGVEVKWDVPLLEGYPFLFMKNNAIKPSIYNGFLGLLNLSIITYLYKNRKDMVLLVHGWNRATYVLAFLTCIVLRIPYIIHAENPISQELKKSFVNRLVKKVYLRTLFHLAYKVCFIGKENKQFYQYYGVKDGKCIFTPYSVDNNFFQSKYNELILDKDNLRDKIFTKGKVSTIFLFSGKLIEKKRPLDLLKAFIKLNSNDVGLIFMGDGSLRNEIQNIVLQNQLNNVIITGFVNQAEISSYFVLADVFVLPSGMGETWGLVVNEAMNFSLPIITSDLVGSAADLNKENGIVYPCGNVEALFLAMTNMMERKSNWKEMGKRSLNLINGYSNTVRTKNLLTALNEKV